MGGIVQCPAFKRPKNQESQESGVCEVSFTIGGKVTLTPFGVDVDGEDPSLSIIGDT